MSKGRDVLVLPKCGRADVLHTALRDALHRRYGVSPDALIDERIAKEWDALVGHDVVDDVAFLYELVCWLKGRDIPYVMRYTAGASLLFFLLGITRGNPLPPHGYCPVCGRIYWGDTKQADHLYCSIDGASLSNDGHDIPWQVLWGYGDSFLRFHIDISADDYQDVIDYIAVRRSADGTERISVSEKDGEKTVIVDRIIITFAVNMATVQFDDVAVLAGSPNDASSEQIVFREDVYRWLLSCGFGEKEAWKGMEYVRKGRGLPRCIAERLGTEDARLRDECEAVRYLPSRAHMLEEFLYQYETRMKNATES